MAKITTTSTGRVLIYPGEAQSVLLRVTNDSSNTITGIKVQAVVYGDDLNTDGGTVEVGYIIGSDDAFLNQTISKNTSVDLMAAFTPGSWLTDEFGDGIRSVPINLRFTVRYANGGMMAFQSVLENAYLLNYRYAPQVDAFKLIRADDGIGNDEGEDVMATLKLGLRNNSMTSFMKLKVYYAENASATEQSPNVLDFTSNIPMLLTGVTNSTSLILNKFSNGSDWNFLLVFGDEYESISERANIFRAFANVHLSGEPTGGVCFGGFCQKTTDTEGNPQPKFECHYPAYFYGGIALGGAGDYSLEEQDTGSKWIDGKPIYRRVFTGSVKASTTLDLATNIGFDAVISCEGILSYVNSSGVTIRRSMNYFSSTTNHSRLYTGTSDGGKIQANSTQAGDVFVLLEYTKLTDSGESVATLIDSDGIALVDSTGAKLATTAAADVYQLKHTGAQVDTGITQANELYGKYTAGELPTQNAILQAVYPVGAIYMSATATSPDVLFGFGTWQRIQDTFLLAAGSNYAAGSTGGEATHTMTVDEMPGHTHVQLGAHGGEPNTSPVRQSYQEDGHVVVYDSTGEAIWYNNTFSNAEKTYRATTINVDGTTGSTGGNQPYNNMPPYLAVYVWQRTA